MAARSTAHEGAAYTQTASYGSQAMTMEDGPLLNAVKAQTEAIKYLTEALERLALSLHESSPRKSTPRYQQSVQYWYRTWHPASRARENKDGDIVAGNPDWTLESEDDIALHFGEFHSDKTSKKDTGLISVTHDPIRAIKSAYQKWYFDSFNTRDAGRVYISIIQSTDVYTAKDLKERVLVTPIRTRLSIEARNRLNQPENARLYDSEGLFVSKVPKEQIRLRVSLQDLFDQKLLVDMLPELDEEHEHFPNRLGPSAIRNRILCKCHHAADRAAGRFKSIYCALAGASTTVTKQSLKLAQELMLDDPTLDKCVGEAGSAMLQKEMGRLRVRRRGVPQRFVEDEV
jgi:hypothetical protein